jgi:hypothetical protein
MQWEVLIGGRYAYDCLCEGGLSVRAAFPWGCGDVTYDFECARFVSTGDLIHSC